MRRPFVIDSAGYIDWMRSNAKEIERGYVCAHADCEHAIGLREPYVPEEVYCHGPEQHLIEFRQDLIVAGLATANKRQEREDYHHRLRTLRQLGIEVDEVVLPGERIDGSRQLYGEEGFEGFN